MARTNREGARVDAIVVAYNSAGTLRAAVEPLAAIDGVHVIVVDNASPDASAATIADLPVTLVRAAENRGFAAGCNLGTPQGDAPYVLLINPDARIGRADLDALVAELDGDELLAVAAPRILEADGTVAPSLRRFPRLRSTYAQALFLHRILPRAGWTDELVRDPDAYARPGDPDWVSGACMLVRRSALTEVGGLDEGFFLYCEDIDLCARLRDAGWGIRYVPAASARHEGGVSGPREELLRIYARNRVRYARIHARPAVVPLEALGVILGHATHAVAAVTRPRLLRGHLAALAAVLVPSLNRSEVG
jgi:N-acetylglucosaminyl-diphospho-decaprenol L-rhamnosyltransferase